MKTLRTLYTALAVLIITSMSAQKANKQVATQTITKQLSIKNSKGTINYTVKAHTKAADYVTMKGLSKKEQTRKEMASTVTTTIHVDNDTDPFYDNIMAFTYKSTSDTPVKIVPTTTGFNVVLVGRQISYDFMEKMYDLPADSDIEWQKIAVK